MTLPQWIGPSRSVVWTCRSAQRHVSLESMACLFPRAELRQAMTDQQTGCKHLPVRPGRADATRAELSNAAAAEPNSADLAPAWPHKSNADYRRAAARNPHSASAPRLEEKRARVAHSHPQHRCCGNSNAAPPPQESHCNTARVPGAVPLAAVNACDRTSTRPTGATVRPLKFNAC